MVDASACGSMGDMNLSPDGEFREYKLSCCEAVPKLVAPLPRLAIGLEGVRSAHLAITFWRQTTDVSVIISKTMTLYSLPVD